MNESERFVWIWARIEDFATVGPPSWSPSLPRDWCAELDAGAGLLALVPTSVSELNELMTNVEATSPRPGMDEWSRYSRELIAAARAEVLWRAATQACLEEDDERVCCLVGFLLSAYVLAWGGIGYLPQRGYTDRGNHRSLIGRALRHHSAIEGAVRVHGEFGASVWIELLEAWDTEITKPDGPAALQALQELCICIADLAVHGSILDLGVLDDESSSAERTVQPPA